MQSLIEFTDKHPAGSRQLLHGVLLSTVLGIAATASIGAAPWWLFVIWLLLYLVVALAFELMLGQRQAAIVHQVRSGSDYEMVARDLEAIDELIGRAQQIELLTGTLKTFTERSANIKALYERHRAGAQVRLLMMAPQGDGVQSAAAERSYRGAPLRVDDLRQEIAKGIGRLLLEFPQDVLSQILRLYTGSPHSAIARYGDCYIVTMYTFGRGGSSPTFALQRPQHKAFCQALDRGFQELWEAKSTIRLDVQLIRTLGLESVENSPS